MDGYIVAFEIIHSIMRFKSQLGWIALKLDMISEYVRME